MSNHWWEVYKANHKLMTNMVSAKADGTVGKIPLSNDTVVQTQYQ